MRLPLSILVLTFCASAQNSNWVYEFANHYAVLPNITYLTANNYEAKLDLYERRDAQEPQPTLIYIHG
ncbi:MAG TPA: alpha/beta hydrolase, partial [Bryobacteraceae bacterium]